MTYLRSGDPARNLTDYYPSWLDNLADDVTIEGSAMDGVAHGPEAVRTILVAIRTLYEYQEFNFVGPVGDNGILEDYTAQVHGEPISCVVLVTRDAAGQTQHIVASYRPRSSVLLLSRLVGEKLAETPMASTSPPANPERSSPESDQQIGHREAECHLNDARLRSSSWVHAIVRIAFSGMLFRPRRALPAGGHLTACTRARPERNLLSGSTSPRQSISSADGT
jgi:hypothetical protein